MNTKPFLKMLLTMELMAGFVSCKKEADNPPAWFTTHSRFYYDVSTDTSALPGHVLYVDPVDPFGATVLSFIEQPVDTPITSYFEYFRQINGILRPRADGLYRSAAKVCGLVGPISDLFYYLTIPADVQTGTSITQYACGHDVAGYNKILNADTIITVPAGTYHTFCVLHPNNDRSYWNRETGIIMYEVFQSDPTLPLVKQVTLKLRSME